MVSDVPEPATPPDPAELRETLNELGEQLTQDLSKLFGFQEVEARLSEAGRELRLEVEGAQGRFALAWPPGQGLTEAEGRLGAHARIALELTLAAGRPFEFFEGYRPVSEKRRAFLFDRLRFYVEDSLGETGYYDPLVIEQRGPVMLVYSDDEYVLVAESGHRRGSGLLDWKVKRLLSYALTDADEHFGT